METFLYGFLVGAAVAGGIMFWLNLENAKAVDEFEEQIRKLTDEYEQAKERLKRRVSRKS